MTLAGTILAYLRRARPETPSLGSITLDTTQQQACDQCPNVDCPSVLASFNSPDPKLATTNLPATSKAKSAGTDSSNDNTPMIIGVAAAVVVLVIVLAFVVLRRRTQPNKQATSSLTFSSRQNTVAFENPLCKMTVLAVSWPITNSIAAVDSTDGQQPGSSALYDNNEGGMYVCLGSSSCLRDANACLCRDGYMDLPSTEGTYQELTGGLGESMFYNPIG
jgi:hypothetical protein